MNNSYRQSSRVRESTASVKDWDAFLSAALLKLQACKLHSSNESVFRGDEGVYKRKVTGSIEPRDKRQLSHGV
jgi:hypothetical protein